MRAAFFLAIEFIGLIFRAASYDAFASFSLPSSESALPRRFCVSSSAPKFSMMNLLSLTASSHLPAMASWTASSAYCERGLRCSLVSVFTEARSHDRRRARRMLSIGVSGLRGPKQTRGIDGRSQVAAEHARERIAGVVDVHSGCHPL